MSDILFIASQNWLFLKEMICKSPSFYKNINDFSAYRVLIIECEQDENKDGKPVKRQELLGIEFVKELRRIGVKVPIIFTSFLTRRQILKKNSEFEIINTVGHQFVQLPVKPEQFLRIAGPMRNLTETELRDIQLFACHPDGIVNAKIHQLPSLTGKIMNHGIEFVNSELEKCIQEIHKTFQLNPEDFLFKFKTNFPAINQENINSAILFITEKAKSLITEYKIKIGESGAASNDKRPWKLLLLDDEITEASEVVKLIKSNGVEVICTTTAKDAMKVLENDDQLRGKISLILTDYRLYEIANDGVQEQQSIQGYTFLQEVGNKFYSRILSAIVYSGMARQFLFETFSTYNIKTEIFSKIDFNPETPGSLNHLMNRILELGDKNYQAMLALPLGNTGWKNHLHEHYIQFRNLPNYDELEMDICDYCDNWIEGFRAGLKPATPMIKGDAFNAKKNEPLLKTNERFMAYYKTRRLALYLYLFYEFHKDAEIRTKVADRLMAEGKNRANDEVVKGFFSQILGLSPTEFPFGATIEELYWFENHQGIKVFDGYKRYRAKLLNCENLIGDFISSYNELKKVLENDNYVWVAESKAELKFNPDNCCPYLFDKLDLGLSFEWMKFQKEKLNKFGIEESLQLIDKIIIMWT